MSFRNSRRMLLLSVFFLCIAFMGVYFIHVYRINHEYRIRYNDEGSVALRKFPYPYRAALAVSSDIDRTGTLEEFLEIQEFLNTNNTTSMGKGVGLEIGNSFLMFEAPDGTISYFNSKADVAQTIREFVNSGRIDFIHSFGKKEDFSRADAIRALTELTARDCKVDVWVDHAKTNDNWGNDVTVGRGDLPGSEEYHADLTLAYGIKFAWMGATTMKIGQTAPITPKTFTNLYDSDHHIHSLLNISKEFAKHFLSILGNQKYAVHKENDLVKITTLDDGQKVYEFMRFDNFWQGVATGANSAGLGYVLSKKNLDRLKDVGGYMIVYTHLGMNENCSQYICPQTQTALRELSREFYSGDIYVTTTSKLLNYYITQRYLDWEYESTGDKITIKIHGIDDPIFGHSEPHADNLAGITFNVPSSLHAEVYLGAKKHAHVTRNPSDHTNSESITISVTK